VEVDASGKGLGVCLAQLDDDNRVRPILYLSKKLTDRQIISYNTCEKECMSIIFGLGRLSHYLYGTEFTLYTDSKALVWLQNNSMKNNRLYRWSLSLQAFNFKIVHKKGILNSNVDSLSRNLVN
jgi:hypothetical protein